MRGRCVAGWFGLALALAGGCRHLPSASSSATASARLSERTGHGAAAEGPRLGIALPAGVDPGDGLGREEAVAIALANNAAFKSKLAELGLADADVVQAGVIPNPELYFLSAVGVKQLEYTIEFPVDAFLLRPRRQAIARVEAERVAEAVVQAGLDVVRDVRVAYADVLWADDRWHIANDTEKLRARIAGLATARLKAGDASPVETATAQIESLGAPAETARAEMDLEVAKEKLRFLMGTGGMAGPISPSDRSFILVRAETEALVQDALARRPDMLAAAHAIDSAEQRRRLARADWIRFFVNYDANGHGAKGYESGPGFRLTLPIFNLNQGRIARADAELEQALAQEAEVRDRAILEVRTAFLQYQQARDELARWQKTVLPAVNDAIDKAQLAYKGGDTTLVLVLETTRRLIEARLQEARAKAELRRAAAELERSVGHRLTPPSRE